MKKKAEQFLSKV